MVEMGNTKVTAAVYGPREVLHAQSGRGGRRGRRLIAPRFQVKRRREAEHDRVSISCEYRRVAPAPPAPLPRPARVHS
jgi:hypothetical protein